MESIIRNKATVADIKRLEDAPTNPLTGQPWPKGHADILKTRRKLPVYENFEEILGVYHQNQVFVLSSETGSGKSTQVPQLLMYDEYASGLRVACTQPRRLAVTALTSRVSKESGVVLGQEVGYHIGGDAKTDQNKKKTRLAYMTEAVVLGKQASDKDLSEYACIIIDDAHERTVETDLLMAMLKKVISRRKDFKVVIMSATMDAGLFQNYFNQCPLVHITGRNFNVEVLYTAPKTAYSDFVVLAVKTVMHIHKNKEPGHILVFLPGQEEISEACDLLGKYAETLDVFPLYSKLDPEEQAQALGPSGQNRKCIVSTNIAETSLTIDNVVYVVDTGLARQMIYNPRLGMEMLRVMPISQASARQRAGRAGRTSNGVCYRLYGKDDFDQLSPSTDAAIRTTSVHYAALRLVTAGRLRVADFDWIEAPHPEALARAAQDLRNWGFITDEGKATKSGRLAAKCPLEPIWYRAIEEGAKLGCAVEIVDIAVLSTLPKSIFLRPPTHQRVADASRAAFAPCPSDHLGLTNAFNLYNLAREKIEKINRPDVSIDEWCKLHFLDIGALEDARKARERLGPFLKSAGFQASCVSTTDMTTVRKALAAAFCTQLAIYHTEDDEYRTVPENVPARLGPHSSLLGCPYEWIVYSNFTMSSGRVHLNIASPIDPEWLVDQPSFQTERLPIKGDGSLRQPRVKQSLDAARARIAAKTI